MPALLRHAPVSRHLNLGGLILSWIPHAATTASEGTAAPSSPINSALLLMALLNSNQVLPIYYLQIFIRNLVSCSKQLRPGDIHEAGIFAPSYLPQGTKCPVQHQHVTQETILSFTSTTCRVFHLMYLLGIWAIYSENQHMHQSQC